MPPRGRGTMEMVPACAVWLRLLVTALLCAAGLAHPAARRSEAPAELRAGEPMQLFAATREGEVSRIRKRGIDDPERNSQGLVEADDDPTAADTRVVDVRAFFAAVPGGSVRERPRARGPPVA
jgi:hypothetical protein